MASNPLLSTSKSSDSGLRAALHPLVLLTISDYITRHRLCQQTQPIVGALLGQQIGREITIEVAYDVAVKPPADITTNAEAEKQQPREWKLDDAFFAARLAQYKEVHKAPALDLVGWWTVAPAAGPGPEVLSLHQHVLKEYNESALLLTFVPEAVQNISGSSEQQQRLPLTIYETVYESAARRDEGGGEPMQVEGESEKLEMRFKELGYEIQTGEAEMIGVDSVARSGGNAMVGDGGAAAKAAGSDEKPEEGKKKRGRPPKGKGKIKEESEENVEAVESQDLNAEEEESESPPTPSPRMSVSNDCRSAILPQRPRQRRPHAPLPYHSPEVLPRPTPALLPHRRFFIGTPCPVLARRPVCTCLSSSPPLHSSSDRTPSTPSAGRHSGRHRLRARAAGRALGRRACRTPRQPRREREAGA